MLNLSHQAKLYAHRLITITVAVAILAVTSAFTQTHSYHVELAVSSRKKSVMTDAMLTFDGTTMKVVPEKKSMAENTKQFAYTYIKQADASFAKKPMLSGGGAVATALLVGFIFALPFLFIKKKKHWMAVQTDKEFAVMQLGDNDWRQIPAEFTTHGVKVNDLGEEGKGDKKGGE